MSFNIWRREQDSNPRTFRSTVFKTAAIDHSAIPPCYKIILSIIRFFISFLPSLLFKNSSQSPFCKGGCRGIFISLCKISPTSLENLYHNNKYYLFMSSAGDCFAIADCHCETPLRRCGNLIFSRSYEIASLIVFARNDIVTQSPGGGVTQ